MLSPRSARRAICAAAAATFVLGAPTVAAAAMAATLQGTSSAVPAAAAGTALPACQTSQLRATQNHVGTAADVSSIDEMDTVTVTIENDGSTCSGLGAVLYLQATPNSVTLVWPEVFWRIDDGSWMRSSVQTTSCRAWPSGPTESCVLAILPTYPPIASGTTTLDVALYFTSWNDANYSFSGTIAPNDDGSDLDINQFGPGSTNVWDLECATCVNTGTTILPPGHAAAPPSTTSAGGGKSAVSSPAAPSAGHSSSSAAAAPSSSAAPSASESSAATITGPADPTPSVSASAAPTVALTASSTSGPSPVALGIAGAAIIALGGGLFLARRQRRTATAGETPAAADTPHDDSQA